MSPFPSPLETTFSRLRGVAWETAHQLGKEVHLELSGEPPEWEDDEVAKIQDALVQIVRNAIDHGIEPPSLREKSGKARAGRIRIQFAPGPNDTVVTVQDDGAGVDIAAVAKRAIQLGLVPESGPICDGEALALLFQPGFSTKKTITEISGRGIGLDIVQAATVALAGKVEIDTTRGEGTIVRLRIPRKYAVRAA